MVQLRNDDRVQRSMNNDQKIDTFSRLLAIIFSPLLAVAYVGYWLFAVLPDYLRRALAINVAGQYAADSVVPDVDGRGSHGSPDSVDHMSDYHSY